MGGFGSTRDATSQGVHYRETAAAEDDDKTGVDGEGEEDGGELVSGGDSGGGSLSGGGSSDDGSEKLEDVCRALRKLSASFSGEVRRLSSGHIDDVLSIAPARTPECRPSPGGAGGCDAIAHALGDKEVRMGANMVAIAVPGRVLPCPKGVTLTLTPVTEDEVAAGAAGADDLSGAGDVDVVLHFGIIDILQEYNAAKSLETTVKGAAYGRDAISSVDPVSYSRRFQRFLQRVFE